VFLPQSIRKGTKNELRHVRSSSTHQGAEDTRL